jgi:hypothetical protein
MRNRNEYAWKQVKWKGTIDVKQKKTKEKKLEPKLPGKIKDRA